MNQELETKINQFQDSEKRIWNVRVTVSTLRDCRDILNIDLNDAIDPSKDVVDRLSNDPVLMFDVIYLCCKKQMDAKGVTADQFSEAINGKVIEDASQALLDAIIDFFPPSKTEVIRKGLALRDKMAARIREVAMEGFANVNDEVVNQAIEALVSQSGNTSSPAPAPSE